MKTTQRFHLDNIIIPQYSFSIECWLKDNIYKEIAVSMADFQC